MSRFVGGMEIQMENRSTPLYQIQHMLSGYARAFVSLLGLVADGSALHLKTGSKNGVWYVSVILVVLSAGPLVHWTIMKCTR